jgi:enamine deaminase RidA (YjgF/YER057c/UK114 family)
MSRQLISTGSPFEQAFGYSRAVIEGDMVFVSGTTGYDYATMVLPEDVAQHFPHHRRGAGAGWREPE